MPYKQGIFLDIFICDNVPDNYILRCLCNFHSFIYRKIFYSEVGKYACSGISKLIYKILSLIPEKTIKNRYNKYVRIS